MTAMNGMAGVRAPEAALAIPRLEDGFANMREPLGRLAESVVNEMMSAEADRLCEATGNGRDGYRERSLVTCVGTLAPRVPRLRTGSFLPDDATARVRRRARGSSRPSSASGTSAPRGRPTTWPSRCSGRAAGTPRGSSRRPSPTRRHTSTSRPRTGGARVPTTCGRGRTGRQGAGRAWRRSSRRLPPPRGWRGRSRATWTRSGRTQGTSRSGGWASSTTSRGPRGRRSHRRRRGSASGAWWRRGRSTPASSLRTRWRRRRMGTD